MAVPAAEPAASYNFAVKIEIDGKGVVIPEEDQQAFITGDRTYVPLRVISENLGAIVGWNPQTRQVVITTAGKSGVPVPSRPGVHSNVQIVVDGEVKNFPPGHGAPFITTSGRTVVPLRAVGETLGCEVVWDGARRLVDIKSGLPEDIKSGVPEAGSIIRELASYSANLRLIDGTFVNSADLPNMDESKFSAVQIEQFKSFINQLSKYNKYVTLPGGQVIATSELTITGPALASANQLRAWIAAETPRIRAKMQELNRPFLPIPDLYDLYLSIGAEYGIRGDLAFAQAAKETHYWQFTGDVQPHQNNYCGLAAVGRPLTEEDSLNGADPDLVQLIPGTHGATFASPEVGVEAHIQHLYAYAHGPQVALPPGKKLLSPRYNLVNRGSAPTWQQLNARWAVPGLTYGQSIIHDYWIRAVR